MSHGGKREGAGRPLGSPTRKTEARKAAIAASGLTPLEFMLDMLRDTTKTVEDRMWAAEKAAPYVHAKLASVAHTDGDGGPLQIQIIKRVYDAG